MTVNLVTANKENAMPDFNNIACQIRLDFRSLKSKNASVTINTVIEGEYRPPKDEGTDPDELFSGKFYMNISKPQVVVTVHSFTYFHLALWFKEIQLNYRLNT